jgi:hypothetical protein
MSAPRWLPLHFLAPVLVPMACAVAMLALGSGPGYKDALEQLKDADKDMRRDALDWLEEIRRPSVVPHLAPLLEDPESRVREKAARVLGKMRSPDALPHLHGAMLRGDMDPGDVAHAMRQVGYPHALAYFEEYLEHADPGVREAAEKERVQLLLALNKEMCFFAVGAPVYNELGHSILSQALMFEEGRRLAENPAEAGYLRDE